MERFKVIFLHKTALARWCSYHFYRLFYFATALVVWMAHKRLFRAGNNDFGRYWRKMRFKFTKTIGRLKQEIRQPVITYRLQKTV
jgi:hypothetical protein